MVIMYTLTITPIKTPPLDNPMSFSFGEAAFTEWGNQLAAYKDEIP